MEKEKLEIGKLYTDIDCDGTFYFATLLKFIKQENGTYYFRYIAGHNIYMPVDNNNLIGFPDGDDFFLYKGTEEDFKNRIIKNNN